MRMENPNKIAWIEPPGGVLVVADTETAKSWNGSSGNDYEFACSFTDYTSVTTYNSKQIIVLGDEPMRTGVWRKRDDRLFIIRWVYAESESEISRFIGAVNFNREIPIKKQTICLDRTRYLLFDGVEAFGAISEFVKFDLPKGTYTIETYDIGNESLRIIIDRIEIIL